MSRATSSDASVDEAAARWHERLLDENDQATRAQFDAWLAGAPDRASAYARVEHARQLAEALADAPELRALRHDTMNRIARTRSWTLLITHQVGAMAAAIVLLFVGAYGLWRASIDVPQFNSAARALVERAPDGGRLYETAIGQRLVVTLEDSSVITLDTASRVSVSFTGGQRAVRLYAGQAFFRVAHDERRPFVVTAADTRIVALGTEFDVRLAEDKLAVTLVTGRVRVERAADAAPDQHTRAIAVLDPGQQYLSGLSQHEQPQLAAVDVQRATAWRRGQLIFERQTLGYAVNEMNRYTRRQIVLRDPALAQVPISGAFETGQSAAFVEALTSYFPIEIMAENEREIVLDWEGAPTQR